MYYRQNGNTRYTDEPLVKVIATNTIKLNGSMANYSLGVLDVVDILGGGPSYTEDLKRSYREGDAADDEVISKFAGQMCYKSFGDGATKWAAEDMKTYFKNIMESEHGSVLEHAVATLVFLGVSRSLTHELVRHRAGFSYSQQSQRYVGPEELVFVERPEFSKDPELHQQFLDRIEKTASDYASLISKLEPQVTTANSKRSAKKKAVNQAARALLTNEVEAPIVVTANLRGWRHFLHMRGSVHAEPEIRILSAKVLEALKPYYPAILQDAHLETGPDDYPVIDWRF